MRGERQVSDDKTAVQFPVNLIPRDASPERIIGEIYRLQAEQNTFRLDLTAIKSALVKTHELGTTVEDHRVLLFEHEEKLVELKRTMDRIQECASSMESSVMRMREATAVNNKAAARQMEAVLEKLTLLVDLHQQKVVA